MKIIISNRQDRDDNVSLTVGEKNYKIKRNVETVIPDSAYESLKNSHEFPYVHVIHEERFTEKTKGMIDTIKDKIGI